MNTNSSVVLTSRNALITAVIATVIALAFNPISGYIGYQISKKLRQPRIKIEFVNVNFGYKKISLEQDIVSDIRAYKNVFDKITWRDLIKSFERPSEFMKFIMEIQADVRISGDGHISFDFIESAVKYEDDILSEYDTKIQIIEDNLKILSAQQVFDSALLKKVPDFAIDPVEEAGKRGPKPAYDIVQSWLKKANEERDAFERVLSSFKTILETGRKRSGKISFEVGLLNEGDSDGVVYPDGQLHIGDRILKVESENRQYGVIRGHSFSKYVFQIKEEEVAQKDLDYLNALVSNYTPEEFSFAINTTNGTESIRNKLPVN
jgi:hypothetical protein